MSDENKHRILKNTLKGLPRVKTKNDFESRLLMRLRDAESEKFHSPSFAKLTRKENRFSFSSLLRPALIPAIGLTMILLVFIVYYVNVSLINKNQTKQEITQNVQTSPPPSNEKNEKTDSEKLISKNETSLRNNNAEQYRRSLQEPSTSTSNFENGPTMSESPKEPGLERLALPKSEEQTGIEGKVEDKGIDELRGGKEKEAPVMKKSEYKDTEKDDSRDHLDLKTGNENTVAPNEQQEETKDLKKANKPDSVKFKAQKRSKKDKNYNDSVKSQQNQIEDSTKIIGK